MRLTQKVGVDNVIKVARDLGVTAPLTEDLSLALGTSEIPLVELAEAYASVAAGAYPVLAHGLPPEEQGWFDRLMKRQRHFSDDQLEMIRDLLSSAANRGTGSAAALPVPRLAADDRRSRIISSWSSLKWRWRFISRSNQPCSSGGRPWARTG